MMAVADLEEVFLPMPENLLVNLNECRTTIDSFLETFGRMFKNTTNNYSAMGPAMEAALKLGVCRVEKVASHVSLITTITS